MSGKKSRHHGDDHGLPPLMDDLDHEQQAQDGGRGGAEEPAEGSSEVILDAEAESSDEGDGEWKPDLKPSYVVELEDALKEADERNLELETRVSQLLVSYRKSEEETQRVRERLERERERRLLLDKQKLFRKLLEPMDSLERSVLAARLAQDASPLAMGVELVWKQMLEGFAGSGLERFDPTGMDFDPQQHEALGVIPVTTDEQDGKVLQAEQAGYVLDGELLRPARVLVGRKG